MADTTVTIDVRACAAGQAPGFTDAVLFGGPAIRSYCYQFGGGSAGADPGDVTEKKDGKKKTIDINMVADSTDYRLSAVLLGNDPMNQQSVKSVSGNGPPSRTRTTSSSPTPTTVSCWRTSVPAPTAG